jgi:hypothetical protein
MFQIKTVDVTEIIHIFYTDFSSEPFVRKLVEFCEEWVLYVSDTKSKFPWQLLMQIPVPKFLQAIDNSRYELYRLT